ncbi:MAG: phosphotransferase [Cyanobacteria bacterium SZAS-4]|nr:phosphotransferase [Cyanobacteria bacterium SZAS-4]
MKTIESILSQIPALDGGAFSVSVLAGGMTNHNYLVEGKEQKFVLRLVGEGTDYLGIDREMEYSYACAAAEADLSGEVVAFLPEHGAMLTRFISGRVLSATDVKDSKQMPRVVEALKQLHSLNINRGKFSVFEAARRNYNFAVQNKVIFPNIMTRALTLLDEIEATLAADSNKIDCPCHNDLLPENLIDDGSAVRIIDWEFASMGDLFFDLGNLAVNSDFDEEHEREFLKLYFGEVKPQHLSRLQLMRQASDMREATWGFLQTGISELPVDYLDYGQTHLQRFLSAAPERSQ